MAFFELGALPRKALEKNTKIFRQHAINRYWILLQDMFWCQFFFPVTDLFLLGKWLRFNNYVNFCDSSTHHFLGNQSFSRLLTLLFAGNLSTIGAMFRYIASFILAKFYVCADAILQREVNAKIAISSSVGKAGGKWNVFPYRLTLET